ncbi:EPIDERMAL PATTERNING FACTOR-like protein [Parasponia andersonii]|uniref:Epidermal patterning factor-like protein n=1 Tax=Parasponia andersonii TaxID=3476 RepID=A0A2P5BFV7_PARAD|nr:EPIDERMAL PATTERNING FACTOR-like protein [Parasponia andersonii]
MNNSLLFLYLFLLLSPPPAFCSPHKPHEPPPTTTTRKGQMDELHEDKTRLGSTPPSCHNKCNTCHPCMAVQVPTLPSREPVRPGLTRTVPDVFLDSVNKYFDYKPLGWKCRCGDHLFNP